MGRTSIIPEIEATIGQPLKPWLVGRIQERKTPEEIAVMLKIGKSKVYELIKEFNLKEAIKEAKSVAKTSSGELSHYFNKYMAEKKGAEMSHKTISKDKTLFGLYLWWLEAFHKPLDLRGILDVDIMREFENYLATETIRFGKDRKKVVSPMGRISYRKQFIAFIHWLQHNEIISDEPRANPFTKMMRIKLPKEKPEDIPDEILEKILAEFGDSFMDIRNKTMFTWFLETGQRLGGVAGIKMNHFKWDTGVGTVTEKGKKERTIVLSDKLRKQVDKYLKAREEIARCDSLWIKETGEQLEQDGIYGFFKVLDTKYRGDMIRLAPPKQTIHPHAMRHVWAKHLALAEVPGFAMMVMAGWENLSLVRHYAAAYTQEKAWSYINTASPLNNIGGKDA